jgi:uncharacterized protein YqjF (DUF2071 family)
MEPNRTPFLSAEWRKLVMVNYSVDPGILREFVPKGTELDQYNDICYVSLVGFMFLGTKVKGISIPFHENFPEVNLRFYVRYEDGDEIKRGVVFIKEIVPRRAITFVANHLYGEKYETMPMHFEWKDRDSEVEVTYRWKKGSWNTLTVVAGRTASAIKASSEEDYITNHYWGYTKLSEVATSEYEVSHPVWEVYPIQKVFVEVDFRATYGERFHFLRASTPSSVFLAEGSEIKVFGGRRF